MLFDLRGRHRRRAVRFIYTGLALLMGVGLVGFGIGGGFGGGGFLNAATSNEGGSKSSFAAEIKKYEKLTKQQPSNVAAWEKLTLAHLHEAGGEALVQNGHLTSKGQELFAAAATSWRAYLALNPPKPSPKLAAQMERIFGEEGLNEPAAEVQVLQLIVAEHESASLFGALAQYAYRAKNTRVGDLAAAKAVALVPPARRSALKRQLAKIKEHPNGASEEAASSSPEQSLK